MSYAELPIGLTQKVCSKRYRQLVKNSVRPCSEETGSQISHHGQEVWIQSSLWCVCSEDNTAGILPASLSILKCPSRLNMRSDDHAKEENQLIMMINYIPGKLSTDEIPKPRENVCICI